MLSDLKIEVLKKLLQTFYVHNVFEDKHIEASLFIFMVKVTDFNK